MVERKRARERQKRHLRIGQTAVNGKETKVPSSTLLLLQIREERDDYCTVESGGRLEHFIGPT